VIFFLKEACKGDQLRRLTGWRTRKFDPATKNPAHKAGFFISTALNTLPCSPLELNKNAILVEVSQF
jgi:hypothetical protein